MKKILAIILSLSISGQVLSAPTNVISLTVPTDNTVVSASDEATRYNEITTKFGAHDHQDFTLTTSNSFTIGDNAVGNKDLIVNDDSSNNPTIRFNTTIDRWTISDDGSAFSTHSLVTGTVRILDTQTITGTKTFSDLIADTVDINAGTVDAIVGGTTPAAGTFTTLEATGLITATGGQIKFPASQSASGDANTLDDYEEGTFTMTLAFGGGSTGITYSGQEGFYTKIGNVVVVTGRLTLTDKGSSSGAAVISGLPFTVINSNGGQNVISIFAGALANVDSIQATAAINATTINLNEISNAGVNAVLSDGEFSNTTLISISGMYRVS